ncbi:MAG: sigma-54-dependent Fis family transcriptional regulator [Myxococcales bacterium]|nr:MAG: sigma-54-dependent Fis family transcriptional regulator [Myxococcales bacterium]
MVPKRVLVVDDESSARKTIAFYLRDIGYEVFEASRAEEGLQLVIDNVPPVVISDIRLEGMSGIELLEKIKEIQKNIQVILITAYGTIKDAVSAMSLGAESYLTKPFNLDELGLIVKRAFEKTQLLQETQYLRQQLLATKKFERLVGNHKTMQEIYKIIEQVAPSTANVLVYGESGTGKELIGEAIHRNSNRRNGPFVKVNCAVFTDTLLESELFGHEKGAFTGAYTRKEGRFELADAGTLFLDDVNVMPLTTQVKILRFLQEREFERVGGTKTIKVDVRVLAATNQPLAEEVAKGRFREDLYYRLNVVPINLPPLRERKSDIPILIGHFIKKYAEKHSKDVSSVDDEALALSMAYDWPGNVRELENIIERAVIMTREKTILPKHLPTLQNVSAKAASGVDSLIGRSLDDIEREVIVKTLGSVDGSTKKAAEILKVSVRKIQYKLKEFRQQAIDAGLEPDKALTFSDESVE